MSDKIIFLDIDGPMIPYTSFLFNPHASFDQVLDDRCCRVLHKIIEASGAKIVFNTTHNTMLYPTDGYKTPGLINQFEAAGFGPHIHETLCTSYPSYDRKTCIMEWLHKNSSKDRQWVAIDDVKIDHERAYLTDADLGIGIGEYNHCAKWLGFKSFFVM